MNINIQHHHHYHTHPTAEGQLVVALQKLAQLHEAIMTVSTEVQNLLDLAKQNSTVVGSVDAGMKALQAQVTALEDQIANQTPSLSDDDKAALTEAAGDLSASISTLQGDIPQNTGAAGGTGGAAPGTSTGS